MTATWLLAHGRRLELGPRCIVMGVLNITPDSFSDGGRYSSLDEAFARAERMVAEGADIIDIGGESTRPGAEPISAKEEQARILPVVEMVVAKLGAIVSVDTYRAETARLAVAAGVNIVNDVWGLQKDSAIADLAAETGSGLVLMHTGRERKKLDDVIDDQFAYLNQSLHLARQAGVMEGQIVVDPGFGFAKDTEENLALMARFEELHGLGLPLLAGTSRKRFVGSVTEREGDDRDIATAATSAILRMKGAAIIRVHNVTASLDAVRMADAVLAQMPEKNLVSKAEED